MDTSGIAGSAAAGSAAAGSAAGPWGAVAGGILGMFGGSGGSDAAAQQQAQNQAAQLAWNKQQDPFSAGGNRSQYVPQLNQLMQGGVSGVANDPNYKAMDAQSMQDVQRGMSARGQGGSGQEMLAMKNSSQNNMMGYFNQQYSRLSELSGAGKGGGAAATGQSPGAAYSQKMDQYSNQAGGFGMAMGGLSSIFGNGSSNNNPSTPQTYQGGGGLWNGPQATDPATGTP